MRTILPPGKISTMTGTWRSTLRGVHGTYVLLIRLDYLCVDLLDISTIRVSDSKLTVQACYTERIKEKPAYIGPFTVSSNRVCATMSMYQPFKLQEVNRLPGQHGRYICSKRSGTLEEGKG